MAESRTVRKNRKSFAGLLSFLLCAALLMAGCGNVGAETPSGTEAGDGMEALRNSGEETGDGLPAETGDDGVVQEISGTEEAATPANGEEQTENVDETSGAEKPETSDQAAGDGEAKTDGITEPEGKPAETGAKSPWEGKTVSICGDSLSTFTGYIPDYYSKFYPEMGGIGDVNDTWWMQVVKRTGMKLLKNASYSGATVSGQSLDNHDGRYGCGNQRMADLRGDDGSSPEVIIVMMGANDLLNGIPLGNYDGTSQVPEGNIETFSEAYALMLDKMKTWYPDAEIWCCTAAEVSRWNEAGEKFPFENEHKLTMKDYNAWIQTIAEKKGAKVIDVYHCGLTFENAPDYTMEGTHPNPAGMKLIADKVCEAFGV